MTDSSLDQAVIDTINELMRASSDCAEYDPSMSAKFAAAAKDLGRDLGIAPMQADRADALAVVDRPSAAVDTGDEEDEFDSLLHLLDLQKKAVAAVEAGPPQKARFGWLGLDAWSRW